MRANKKVWLATAGALLGAGTLSAAIPAGLAQRAAPQAAEVRLEVDLSERTLYVYHGGDLMNTFDVAVGEPEHPTPQGDFAIDRIEWNPDWVPPQTEWAEGEERREPDDPENPMRMAKLFFEYPDYYIHGTDVPHTLGQAESHGCIRMNPGDVANLAEFVQEHGGESRSDAWYNRVQRNDGSSHEVTLPDAVPVTIRP